MKRMRCFLVLCGLLPAFPAVAAGDGCAAFKWPIEREQGMMQAAPRLAAGGSLAVGSAAAVGLEPADGVNYAVEPDRQPAAGTFGAIIPLPVPVPGVVQVTLSQEGWIDVVQDGKIVRSSGFSGAKDCPGVRKSVRFELSEGDAVVQISNARVKTMNVAVLPAP